MTRYVATPARRCSNKSACMTCFTIDDWTTRYYPTANKCKLDSPWLGPYLVHRRVGNWCSVTTGLAGTYGSLPGLEEDSETEAS